MMILIKDQIGTRCIIKEDGQKIFDVIHPILKSGKNVTLDFDGVTQFASPFFNFSIGQLLKTINEERLRHLLHIDNINPIGQDVIKLVFENAPRYHGNSDYKKIVDDILAQQSKG